MVYGLFARPPALDAYQKALDDLRIFDLEILPDSEEPAYIFTDGSCSQPGPSRIYERRASYGVRLACLNSSDGRLLASGTLPGRKQTAFRAELFAFMIAMSSSLNSVIHTYCLGVYKGIVKLQREAWSELAWLSSADFDLWKGAWQILNVQGRRLVPVWTPAHKDITTARSAKEAWKIYHNFLTDKSASIISNPLPDGLRQCLEQLILESQQQQSLRDAVSGYLQEIWATHAEAEKASR